MVKLIEIIISQVLLGAMVLFGQYSEVKQVVTYQYHIMVMIAQALPAQIHILQVVLTK